MSTTHTTTELKFKPARKESNRRPKTLGAFHEAKVVGIYRCRTCGCDHYGISAEDAAAWVVATNVFLTALDETEAIETYGARNVSVARFMRCFFCSAPAGSLVALRKDEPYSEPSPLPIIVELPQS